MWYFSWILGLAFAVLFALVNALWLDAQEKEKAVDAR
ncbi:MAG: cytochrome bd-I oxidase subunit CydX [Casimicrobiaceae bacterium]|nr:cytochrome bd-I oxidase subunit CydX [Rhodocyclaceae bacterium]MCX8098576.1 cytochrome bd-I oxidase subunit CydX [Casimicrobiaceae bacterium]